MSISWRVTSEVASCFQTKSCLLDQNSFQKPTRLYSGSILKWVDFVSSAVLFWMETFWVQGIVDGNIKIYGQCLNVHQNNNEFLDSLTITWTYYFHSFFVVYWWLWKFLPKSVNHLDAIEVLPWNTTIFPIWVQEWVQLVVEWFEHVGGWSQL